MFFVLCFCVSELSPKENRMKKRERKQVFEEKRERTNKKEKKCVSDPSTGVCL